jgi:exopolyphosphatase/guanosine-5'-triphosphate,3'-diphosphate pyrophosphatase
LKLAAIDIGSNSIKLVVVEAAASDSFAVLAREKEVVRLGRGTLRDGYLSSDSIDRACKTLKRFRTIAEARGAERILVSATASVREASNAGAFIAAAEQRAGVRVEVLSGIEEARLIGIAAAEGCSPTPNASLVNIDIGGGSTEISLMKDSLPLELYSLKLGAVALSDRDNSADPPKPKELRTLRGQIRAAMERPARELAGARWQYATGTSGTIVALGEVLRLRALREADVAEQGARAPGAEIVLSQLERLNERLAGMTLQERRSVPGISAQRAEIIVAGGQILEGVMRGLKINHLRTCDYALREGVVIDALRQLEAESRPPLPDRSDPRLRSVHAVGRRFGYEEAHAHQVTRLAERIFDALAADHGLTRHDRTLLSAAALLHDAGYHIAHDSHHKHALYLIKNSELTGFSEAERVVIANVARYHRGAPPKERHPDYAALNQQDRQTVCRLAAILRLADSLDRSHDSRVQDIDLWREGDVVHLELLSALDCDREIFAADQRRELFEQIYDCRLELSASDRKSRSATGTVAL